MIPDNSSDHIPSGAAQDVHDESPSHLVICVLVAPLKDIKKPLSHYQRIIRIGTQKLNHQFLLGPDSFKPSQSLSPKFKSCDHTDV